MNAWRLINEWCAKIGEDDLTALSQYVADALRQYHLVGKWQPAENWTQPLAIEMWMVLAEAYHAGRGVPPDVYADIQPLWEELCLASGRQYPNREVWERIDITREHFGRFCDYRQIEEPELDWDDDDQ